MVDLRQLTEQYVAAFHSRDINGVAVLLAESFTLTDPAVTRLGPRHNALEYIQELFTNNPSLHFEAHKILVDASHSALHFAITLDGKTYDGVDVITWEDGKMICLDAYLTARA